MKLDLSKFKKISEDKHQAVLLHPAGHQIKISKKILSPKMQGELSSLPLHYDEGTNQAPVPEVTSSDKSSDENDSAPSAPAPVEKTDQKPANSQAPVVNITVGQPQNSEPQPSVSAPAQPNYFTNGTFDPQKFTMQNPEAPIDSKINILKQNQAQQEIEAKAAQSKSMDDYQKTVEYNKLAQSQGLPTIPVPQAPAMMPSAPQGPQPTPSNLMTSQTGQVSAQPANPYQAFGAKNMGDLYQAGEKEQLGGIYGEANALAKQGNLNHQALQQSQIDQQNLLNNIQEKFGKINDESEKAAQDYSKQTIDPQHYWNSLSTPKKISKTIGLILGGMGGGILHQENPALKQLNLLTDQDIQAQKANIDKSKSMMSFYQQQFGNTIDSAKMVSAIHSNIIANQIQDAAAQTQDPLVRARAAQAAGAFKAKASQDLQSIAFRQNMFDQMKGSQGASPEQKIAFMASTPQEAEAAGKELTSVKNHETQTQAILDAFDKADNSNTLSNRTAHLGYEPASVGVMQSLMMPYLKDAEGRINESELQRTDKLIPRPGDAPEKIAEKRSGLSQFLNEKKPTAVLLPKFGINANQFQRKRFDKGAPL